MGGGRTRHLVVSLFVLSCLADLTSGVSQQPSSLCDLGVCQCPLGGKLECVCDNKLQEILVQAKGAKGDTYVPDVAGSISIKNCLRVRVASRSLLDIRPLRKVVLSNIKHLDLEVEAFHWESPSRGSETQQPGIDIQIINTTIPVLPLDTFKGNFNSILLKSVTVGEIKPLAFANLAKLDMIEIINSRIDNVSPKAFSKFIVNNFLIEGGYVGRLPSYAISSVNILHQLRFENVHFNTIESSAFRITETKMFFLRNCRIELLEGEAFIMSAKGQIFIDDNIFMDIRQGAFYGIQSDPRTLALSGFHEFIFENNTLINFTEYALRFNTVGLKLNLGQIILNKSCSCTEIKNWATKLVSTTTKNPTVFSKTMWCRAGKADSVVYDYEQNKCNKPSHRINWILAGPIAVLILLLGLCSLGFWCYRRRSQKTVVSKHMIVLSPTTYKEDQIQMNEETVKPMNERVELMNERVEPINNYVPPQPHPRKTKS